MDDLFQKTASQPIKQKPLAVRLTPQSLDLFVGQTHLVSPGKLLRRLIESDGLQSVILYGPSGTGKTALAQIIARFTKSYFLSANAVTLSIPELRKILDAAKQRWQIHHTSTILLIDEIHHFNRTQQDALLPDVESGDITLIGITTENPFFYVNTALLSRSQTFEFYPLSDKELEVILLQALHNKSEGYGSLTIHLESEAQNHLIVSSTGDARRMLNALEVCVKTTKPDAHGCIHISLAITEDSVQKRLVQYDKKGDAHYDIVSAFIKSMRGSDPDAALYWMAKMLAGGEDPRFIIRRVIILASEDIGNADPIALVVATAALEAINFVGMPEGRIILAHAVIYAACAPKSNASYLAITAALRDIEKGKHILVPQHLKDANLDQEARGHGKGYKYPHDFPGHFVSQNYLPGKKIGRMYYEPSSEGMEKIIRDRLEALDVILAREEGKKLTQ